MQIFFVFGMKITENDQKIKKLLRNFETSKLQNFKKLEVSINLQFL